MYVRADDLVAYQATRTKLDYTLHYIFIETEKYTHRSNIMYFALEIFTYVIDHFKDVLSAVPPQPLRCRRMLLKMLCSYVLLKK